MHISSSENYIVSGHADGSIKVWITKTKDQLFELLEAHSDLVNCVRFSPDES